jgi:hypothetical protein
MAYEKPSENPIVYTHKDFGAAFFDRALPNAYERMFMISRAINYDMTSFNKLYSTPDYGNRRRYLKNAFRFFDHPIRYVFWKMLPYWASGKLRMFPLYWAALYLPAWWISGSTFARIGRVQAAEDVYEGHKHIETSVEEFSNSRMLSLWFHESEGNAAKGMISSKNYPALNIFCRINYHVRDQNLRKYFAHRERRGADLFTGKPK